MAATRPAMNPQKVRIGLAILSAIVVVSAVLVVVVEGAAIKAIFFAIAAMTIARAALLARSLRKELPPGRTEP